MSTFQPPMYDDLIDVDEEEMRAYIEVRRSVREPKTIDRAGSISMQEIQQPLSRRKSSKRSPKPNKRRVTFIHPELGSELHGVLVPSDD
eukprot:UN12640